MSNKIYRKCVYCLSRIKSVFVKCMQCPDDMILCLECFSNGVEIGKHVTRHDYSIEKVVESGETEFSFFCDGWSFEEEDLLLDAVEHFGFGSWFDVANFVKTRNDRECENHYLRYYVQGNIGKATLASETAMSCGEEFAGNDEVPSGRFQELTVSQQQELGYMALRDDFERDYDNEAEVILSGVSLHYTDTPADTAYKIFQVEAHRERQKGRELRKVIAKNFDLMHDATSVGFRSYCVARKKRSRELKLFHARFMPFAKFMDRSLFFRLFNNLNRQLRLMNHMKTLMKLNKQGHKKLTGNFKRINGNLNGDKKRRKKSSKCY